MSLIACSSDCLYQENGYCNLNHAAAIGVPSETGCIHYIPKQKLKYGDIQKERTSSVFQTLNHKHKLKNEGK